MQKFVLNTQIFVSHHMVSLCAIGWQRLVPDTAEQEQSPHL